MPAELLCFVGCVKDHATLQKLIENYNADFDKNPFTRLMKLKYIDSDFTDYEFFETSKTLTDLAEAVQSMRIESGRNRFSKDILEAILPALKAAEGKIDAVNALVICSNEYEPWELTAFQKFEKGKTWFAFITEKPDDWGKPKGTRRVLFFVRPEAYYREWAARIGLPYSAELHTQMVFAQVFHQFGRDGFFQGTMNAANEDKNDTFDICSAAMSISQNDVFEKSMAEFEDKGSIPGKLLASLVQHDSTKMSS